MNLWIRVPLPLLVVLGLSCAGGPPPTDPAQDFPLFPETISITGLEVSDDGEVTDVIMKGNFPFNYSSYEPDSTRLLIEVSGAEAYSLAEVIPLTGKVEEVRVSTEEHPGGSRMARFEFMGLSSPRHDLFLEGNSLRVRFFGDEVPADSLADSEGEFPGTLEPSTALSEADTGGAPADSEVGENAPPWLEPLGDVEPAVGHSAEPEMGPEPPPAPPAKSLLSVIQEGGSGDLVTFKLLADGNLDFTDFRLQGPDRSVIDLIGITNRVPFRALDVVSPFLEKVRVAQFQTEPEKVTRIVFDMSSPRSYEIQHLADGLEVRFLPESSRGDSVSEMSEMDSTLEPGSPGSGVETLVSEEPVQLEESLQGFQLEESPQGFQEEPQVVRIPPLLAEMEPSPAEGEGPLDEEAGPPLPEDGQDMEPAGSLEEDPFAVETDTPLPGDGEDLEPVGTGSELGMEAGFEGETLPEAAPQELEEMEALTPSVVAKFEDSFPEDESASPPGGPPSLEEPEPEASEEPEVFLGESSTLILKAAKNLYEAQNLSGEGKGYTGTPISLDFKDADVKDVFRLFHEILGFNIVLDPGVGGKLTIVLDDVPADQALDIILKNNGLDKVFENNVIRIATTQKLAQEAAARRQLLEAKELEQEPITFARKLSYAKASEVVKLLRQSGGSSSAGGIISRKGSVRFDERTNVIIISDIPQNIEPLNRLIEVLDEETPQVMIEARIVETDRDFERNFGITWGFDVDLDPAKNTETNARFPHRINVDYDVNLPPPNSATTLGLSFGNIRDSIDLDFTLAAFEMNGDVKIISSPRIATQNNETAIIEQGVQIPVVNTTATEINVEFISASLRLEVTPQITKDNTIIMDINVDNSSPDFVNRVGDVPPIITERAETLILVEDGGTAVIGGIFKLNESFSETGVPGLKRIPFFGWLFKNRAVKRGNTELLIFITPRILKRG